jgi:hypothetical protein
MCLNDIPPDLIIVGTGGYNFIGATTCTVTPMTTVVDVRYSSSQDPNALTTITVSTPTSESGVPFGGRVAIDMLLFNVMLGQSIHGNTVANAWFSGLGNATLSTSFPDAMVRQLPNKFIMMKLNPCIG